LGCRSDAFDLAERRKLFCRCLHSSVCFCLLIPFVPPPSLALACCDYVRQVRPPAPVDDAPVLRVVSTRKWQSVACRRRRCLSPAAEPQASSCRKHRKSSHHCIRLSRPVLSYGPLTGYMSCLSRSARLFLFMCLNYLASWHDQRKSRPSGGLVLESDREPVPGKRRNAARSICASLQTTFADRLIR
jgi:hypothetical protein